MKKLREGIGKLSDDIEKVAETLEDRYTYPNLAKKLEQYRKRLVTLRKHKVVFSSDDPAEVDKEATHAYTCSWIVGKHSRLWKKSLQRTMYLILLMPSMRWIDRFYTASPQKNLWMRTLKP